MVYPKMVSGYLACAVLKSLANKQNCDLTQQLILSNDSFVS